MDGKVAKRERELAIAGLANRQHGVVTRTQLRRLGLGSDAIDYRLRAGRMHFLYRGVFAVGHRVLTRPRRGAESSRCRGIVRVGWGRPLGGRDGSRSQDEPKRDPLSQDEARG